MRARARGRWGEGRSGRQLRKSREAAAFFRKISPAELAPRADSPATLPAQNEHLQPETTFVVWPRSDQRGCPVTDSPLPAGLHRTPLKKPNKGKSAPRRPAAGAPCWTPRPVPTAGPLGAVERPGRGPGEALGPQKPPHPRTGLPEKAARTCRRRGRRSRRAPGGPPGVRRGKGEPSFLRPPQSAGGGGGAPTRRPRGLCVFPEQRRHVTRASADPTWREAGLLRAAGESRLPSRSPRFPGPLRCCPPPRALRRVRGQAGSEAVSAWPRAQGRGVPGNPGLEAAERERRPGAEASGMRGRGGPLGGFWWGQRRASAGPQMLGGGGEAVAWLGEGAAKVRLPATGESGSRNWRCLARFCFPELVPGRPV